MKLLNANECLVLFKKIAGSPDNDDLELRVDVSAYLDRSAAIARLMVALLGGEQPSFLWIREFGIWPSLENWDLFNSLRQGMGDQGLPEMPGHEFEASERERLISYIQVTLLNGWGGVLVGIEKRQRIALSHDSWFSVRRSGALTAQIAMVDEFGLAHRMAKEPLQLTGA